MKVLHLVAVLSSATGFAASSPVTLGSHKGTTRVAISPDGALAASTGDKTIKIWNLAAATQLRALPLQEAGLSLTFTPDGKSIAVRLETGVEVFHVKSCARQWLAASARNTIKVWEVAAGTLATTLEGHTNGVISLASTRDGATLVSGSSDRTVRRWQLPRTGDAK